MARPGRALHYGGVPVPWTVSWTAEEPLFLDHCAVAGRLALCQAQRPGEGKPQFGKPHAIRQRVAIAEGLCDLCGRPLAATTKISLSHARVRLDGALGACVMQVEPLLHRPCALVSLDHCPSLKRDVASGEVEIRQVARYQVQIALMSRAYCLETTGRAEEAAGHAKVVLLKWTDRDQAWLEQAG